MNEDQAGINGDLAPVILFVYNRPEHTIKTLEALNRNQYADRSVLYVFADGPKNDATTSDLNLIERTRDVIRNGKWCKEVNLICREKNTNLEDNIIDGVSEVINRHGKAIVLEDDLVCSPYFLRYCNEGLLMYQDKKQVYAINAFMYPINFGNKVTTFLSPVATFSWGWATWADRWSQLVTDPECIDIIENNSFLKRRFDWADLDKMYILKHMNTWDIRWYYTAFIRNGLGLFPTRSLIQNIGFDGSGTHTGNEQMPQELYGSPISIQLQETISLDHYSKFLNFFKAPPISTLQRVKNKIKRLIQFKFF